MKCLTMIIVVLMGGCLLAGLPHPVMAGMAEKIEADSRKAAEEIKEAVVETREAAIETGRQLKDGAINAGEAVKEGAKTIGREVRDAVTGTPSAVSRQPADNDDGKAPPRSQTVDTP